MQRTKNSPTWTRSVAVHTHLPGVVAVVALSCGTSHPTNITECVPGEVADCTCADGSRGSAMCLDLGGETRFLTCGGCVPEPSFELCVVGSVLACLCEDGGRGRAECAGDGVLEPCDCTAGGGESCRVTDPVLQCWCAAGSRAGAFCSSDDDARVCDCSPSFPCMTMTVARCECVSTAGVALGLFVCDADGKFGQCQCDGPLAGTD